MSAEGETSEIIRRRLFEWYGLPDDAKKTIAEYADWIVDHRQQIPNWFPVDNAREAFAATYPFHPTVLSVFERKWQALPRFQQTRGVLRLLALWVSKAYQEGYKGRPQGPTDRPGHGAAGRLHVPGGAVSSSWANLGWRARSPRTSAARTIPTPPAGHRGRGHDQEGPAAPEGGHDHLLRVQRRPGQGARRRCRRCAWRWPSRGWTSATSRRCWRRWARRATT